MVIKVPQYHEFPESLKEKILDETGHSLPEWEISVSRKDDLAWSIVLSYLMLTNYRDKDDFSRRLKALTGSDENAKLVKKSIRHFNPFRNRFSCFYDETLKTVVNNFKKCLEWNDQSDVYGKLSVASEALECPILLIQDYTNSENYQIFKTNVKRNEKLMVLTAFSTKNSVNLTLSVTSHNFMIYNSISQRMKRAALQHYLNEADIPKKAVKFLTPTVLKEDTFIKAVLNTEYKNYILYVYKSPYVVSKLTEAGYEMDPKAKDSEGFSGLFYALIDKSRKILRKMYFFAVDNCSKSEASFRNPDPSTVINLQCIEELLIDDMTKLEKSNYQQYSDIKTKFEELLKLNKFLIEITRKTLEIKSRLNYYEIVPDIVFEANKRKDAVVSLLDTYEKFLFFNEDIMPFLLLYDYIAHKDYYTSLDMVTAMIYFDNIYLLKERVQLTNNNEHTNNEELKTYQESKHHKKLNNDEKLKNDDELKIEKQLESAKQFSEIESSIFFSILLNCTSEITEDMEIYGGYPPTVSYLFLLKYRLNNFDKLNNLNKILHAISINKGNIVNCISEYDVNSVLYSYPALKDCGAMARLEEFIKISKKLKVIDTKSVLVIERILQIIGECLAPKENDFSFRRFLSLCLPKEIAHILRRLRIGLTHLKGHIFPAKMECEKNLSLFRSILSEIRKINRYFTPVYNIITLKLQVYLNKTIIEDIKNFNFEDPSDFKDLKDFSIKLIFEFCRRNKSYCHDLLKTILENMKDEIKYEYFSKQHTLHDAKNKVLYLLWPLKWLLELLEECGTDCVVPLLDLYKKLESSPIESVSALKENTDVFITECYNILPNFNVVVNKNKTSGLKSAKYIGYFLEVLKGSVFLSSEDKDEIRKEIPEKIKQSVSLKDKLIRSVEEGYSMEVDVYGDDFDLPYLSKTKIKQFRIYYKSKDPYALEILKSQDPIEELEEILSKNCVNKKQYDALCETMQFSEKIRKKLGKIVAGKRTKIPANNLINLLNRIQLLKAIILDEDEEMQELWSEIKQGISGQLINEKIVRRYSKDPQFQAAIEMLLFDCMILFEGVKLPEKLWNKSSKLYQGINVRNIISHGNPLVEILCKLLDPRDMPSEIIKKIILLMKGEDAIKAILELHEHVNKDYTKLLEVINNEESDDFIELRNQIKSCDEWKNYVLLLPDTYKRKKYLNFCTTGHQQ